ncbi:hypothetical protein NC651_007079 [Populus alba x Populus x berolinensis]|nr:hypothetical protein NC651_007079 [Populus alba x Populus x berolinensis]
MGVAGSLGGEGELESQKQAGSARLFLFPRERWPAPPLSKGEVSAVAEEENHQGRLWMEIFEQPREGLWGGRLKKKMEGGLLYIDVREREPMWSAGNREKKTNWVGAQFQIFSRKREIK